MGEFRRWIFGVLGEKGEEDGEGEDVIKEHEPENPWEGIPKPKVPLSVVLQGKVSTASKIVFLFPDGSGAGTAYGSLPDLGEETETEEEGGGKGGGICIIGLNSPFLRQAHNFTCSIERMTRLWYDEVRKLQAQSQSQTPTPTTKENQKEKQTIPYILGGWSAGGYYSYEMAKLLTAAGETVSTLILIDSPCRLLYEALPVQVVEELTKKGLMGASSSSSSSSQQKKAAPEWLVQHFTSTVLSVQRYQPVAMQESRVPENVYCIWVEEGLVETSVEESGLDVDVNVRVTRFLLEGRREKKLESEGWERLLPGAEFGFEYMTGNHFQITQVPHVRFSFSFFFFVSAAGTSLTLFLFLYSRTV